MGRKKEEKLWWCNERWAMTRATSQVQDHCPYWVCLWPSQNVRRKRKGNGETSWNRHHTSINFLYSVIWVLKTYQELSRQKRLKSRSSLWKKQDEQSLIETVISALGSAEPSASRPPFNQLSSTSQPLRILPPLPHNQSVLHDLQVAQYWVPIVVLWKILKEMGIPDHLTCLLRNLYAGQEATVRTGHGTTDWFQIGKGVRQGCILSPCLFNLYAE